MDKDEAKQYHGYLAFPRHAKLLRNHLGYHLFSFYIALVIEARWYRSNPHFSHVVGTQSEIASRLRISQSATSRGFNQLNLIDKKLIIKRTRYIILGYFPLFLTDVANKMYSNNYATLHDLYADMYRINAELQEKYAISHEKRTQNTSQSLYRSSNDNSGSSNTDYQDDINVDEADEAITKALAERGTHED